MEIEPTPQNQNSKVGKLDLSKILLPKKNTPSTDSAQRVDASILMAQEQNATLNTAQQNSDTVVERSQQASDSKGAGGVASQGGDASGPIATPSTPEEDATNSDELNPLQTYQSDIQSVVREKHVSTVSMAAAEATRRESAPIAESLPAPQSHPLRTVMFFSLGFFLFAASAALVWFALFQSSLSAPNLSTSPFIATDTVNIVDIAPSDSPVNILQTLKEVADSISLSLGLVAELRVEYPAVNQSASATPVDARTLLTVLAPSLPDTFVRTIQPSYLLGVHVFGVNQPFLLLRVDSYEQAYAGMLTWERSMHSDLSPLFDYTPASKTPGAQEPSTLEPVGASFVATNFIDRIVKNRDTRVLQTADGSVYFLWTFLDRSTILITTNPETLQEVITRLTLAPLLSSSVPGQ